MKKVLVIANEWSTIVHFRMEILKRMTEEHYQVIVALPVCKEAEPIRELGCELVNLDVSRHGTNPVKDLAMMFQCRKLIRQYRPDVVVTYTVKPNIYGSFACMMTKTHYINNITGIGSVLQSKSVLSSLMLKMMKSAFRKSDCVYFQNRDNYERFLQSKVISEKTPVGFLPGSGVNLEAFRYTPMDESDPVVKFTIVSRIRRDKGYSEFFDAAEAVKAKYPNTEFHVVGGYEEEEYRERLDQLAEQKTVIYHGSLSHEEVFRQIAGSTCLIHPSYHEGMANVILEAAATGRPVIASNISGCKEGVDDGKTGYLFDVQSSEALIRTIEKFLSLSKKEQALMGQMGRKKMEDTFDRRLVSQILIDRIESI